MKIVPAILSDNFNDFLLKIKQAETFADYVQIDLMDAVFVPTTSFPAAKLNDLTTKVSFELHLMVKHPSAFIMQIDNPMLKKVIFHVESDVKHRSFIRQMNKRGIDSGIAINPESDIESFKVLAAHVTTLLFLTVDPCCYGNPFKPEVLKKVELSRKLFPDKMISVDGGVSFDNLKKFLNLGVDSVCIGSRIFLNGDPADNYKLFVKKIKEIETDYAT